MRVMRNTVWMVAAITLVFAGCKKDGQVMEDLAIINGFTDELVAAALSANQGEPGLDVAQALLEERGGEVAAAMERIGSIRGFQVSDETKSQMTSAMIDNASRVNSLQIELFRATFKDPSLDAKLDQVISDYNAIFSSR